MPAITAQPPSVEIGERHSPLDRETESLVEMEEDSWYRIAHFDRMEPFLVCVPSASDLWMYVSTNGGLTAGRVCPERCLFPYETVDRLHHGHWHTGPMTLLRWRTSGGVAKWWQPLENPLNDDSRRVRRYLLKNIAGNRLRFEERSVEDGLSFSYEWQASDEFGFVRTARLSNFGKEELEIEILDGLQNLMPYGVELSMQQRASCLVDAYRLNECDPRTGLAIFSLTSRILDVSAAAEIHRATVAWSVGLDNFTVLLSPRAQKFVTGQPLFGQLRSTGQRGHYFLAGKVVLPPQASKDWRIVADVAKDHRDIAKLREQLQIPAALEQKVALSLSQATERLTHIVACADGLQLTADRKSTAHHRANVLFNNMRGGVFAENYDVQLEDFCDFLRARNKRAYALHAQRLAALPRQLEHRVLPDELRSIGDRDLLRIGHEYLPLVFSRRHGDPSRPWNTFLIRAGCADGKRVYNYEGNWRDIFQNWEALATSFPGYLPSMVAKFVNASTVDGYNAYRLSRNGIDWERPEPGDSWNNLGYWGDHQIVYLARLLEAWQAHAPQQLLDALHEDVYCYAQVPYRLSTFDEIVADSRQTIQFDEALDRQIVERSEELGIDAQLLQDAAGEIYYVTLLEKLIVPALSKLSNLVVDGGIWLNTQRPEWNDAHNALAGPGLSVVTVCHLRQYLAWLAELLQEPSSSEVLMSNEVADLLEGTGAALEAFRHELVAPGVADEVRWRLLSQLGDCFDRYRRQVYAGGLTGKRATPLVQVIGWCRVALEYLDHTIVANRRCDGLAESYNLLSIDAQRGCASVRPLSLMLAGQVALLSARVLTPEEVVELIGRLYDSPLYREDQQSFLLYPERTLPGFMERNCVPGDLTETIELIRRLLGAGDESVIVRDSAGQVRFSPEIETMGDLEERLSRLASLPEWGDQVRLDRQAMLSVFDAVFQHRQFTGRAGVMYGYEGIGCVYWHKVAKLLLAVQESYWRAVDDGAAPNTIHALARGYYQIRRGLGFEKSAKQFGAFPTDPYSHTPLHAGAQQPGMTGQVKEEILTRRGELGVRIRRGRLLFQPTLLRRREFLAEPAEFDYYNLLGHKQRIRLEPQTLAFTVCQTPIVYRLSASDSELRLSRNDGQDAVLRGPELDAQASREIFGRSGVISRITVDIPADAISLD